METLHAKHAGSLGMSRSALYRAIRAGEFDRIAVLAQLSRCGDRDPQNQQRRHVDWRARVGGGGGGVWIFSP